MATSPSPVRRESDLKPHEVRRTTLSRDTDPRAEAVQLEIFRRMPPWRKTQIVQDAILTSRQLALAGLRSRHPKAGPEELHYRLMRLLHGEELTTKIWGSLEDYVGRSKKS